MKVNVFARLATIELQVFSADLVLTLRSERKSNKNAPQAPPKGLEGMSFLPTYPSVACRNAHLRRKAAKNSALQYDSALALMVIHFAFRYRQGECQRSGKFRGPQAHLLHGWRAGNRAFGTANPPKSPGG